MIWRFVVGPLIAAMVLVGCVGSMEVPPNEGIQIPFVLSAPRLDRVLSAGEWDAARWWDGNFTIAEGAHAGRFPFRAGVALTEERLWIVVLVEEFPPRQPEPSGRIGSDDLSVFLGQGEVVDWKILHNMRDHGSSTQDGYWVSGRWMVDPSRLGMIDDNGTPTGGAVGRGGSTDRSALWEISIPRMPSPPYNPVDLHARGEIRFALVLSRPSEEANDILDGPLSIYPETATIHEGPASPGWLRLSIPPP